VIVFMYLWRYKMRSVSLCTIARAVAKRSGWNSTHFVKRFFILRSHVCSFVDRNRIPIRSTITCSQKAFTGLTYKKLNVREMLERFVR